ncbi:hypothetical protein E4U13_008067 [Claviceps humidiphila]|uniref:Uncharacterized protein n=1 Tax=Claviceps humidiphila TaxID=1294629 RepID=A0A9P7TTU4_9HYPO|nr:hypothetical protein E4U13_008067 [Claviceps humidiphila]
MSTRLTRTPSFGVNAASHRQQYADIITRLIQPDRLTTEPHVSAYVTFRMQYPGANGQTPVASPSTDAPGQRR